jgi:AcrR family transcriptional regulator
LPVDDEAPQGPRSRKGVRTRARLLDAAKQIFEESGFLDARISDIAERAGLSHGSFYHYFDSKEQVFREVAESVDERLSEPMNSVVFPPPSSGTPRDRLRAAIRQHLEAYRDEAEIMGVIEQVSRYDEHVHARRKVRYEQYRDQMANSIRQLQRRGMADRSLDPLIAASALGSMTLRFAETWFVEGSLECTLDEGADQLTILFANALQLKDKPASPPRGAKGK